MATENHERAHVHVSGRVQGVFFRDATRLNAAVWEVSDPASEAEFLRFVAGSVPEEDTPAPGQRRVRVPVRGFL